MSRELDGSPNSIVPKPHARFQVVGERGQGASLEPPHRIQGRTERPFDVLEQLDQPCGNQAGLPKAIPGVWNFTLADNVANPGGKAVGHVSNPTGSMSGAGSGEAGKDG